MRAAPLTPQKDFSDWHPLATSWLHGLAPETQAIAACAQQCFADSKRTDGELSGALLQISTWRKDYPELTDRRQTPTVIFEENLGSQLKPAAFVHFLLEKETSLTLPTYEYTALSLLQEAKGLADICVVCRRDSISSITQHLTLNIARLHTATVLLRQVCEQPRCRDSIEATLKTLLTSSATRL